MVIVGTELVAVEFVGNKLSALAAAHIDNGRACHRTHNVHQFGHLFACGTDDVGDVVAGKTLAEHVALAELQLIHDVGDHCRGCRGGQSQHGNIRKELAYLRDAQKRRPEVVAPLRDAVRLVDNDKANRHVLEAVEESRRAQTLG